jgi:ketosteroid isomerase-like protein
MPSPNHQLVADTYAAFARGDVPAVLGAFAPDMVWNEAENFPLADGNPYIGPEAVLNGVFMRLATEWDGFTVNVEQIHDAGDTVIARGRYTGTYKATGAPISAQLAHVWTIKDGKLAAFQQYVDTHQVRRAVGG